MLCNHLAHCSTAVVVGMGIRFSYQNPEIQQILCNPCGDHRVAGVSIVGILLVNRGILPEFSIGPFSVYAMTDFRVNEIASSFQEILSNFRNLLYLLYRQDIGRPYDVIMPFGFSAL